MASGLKKFVCCLFAYFCIAPIYAIILLQMQKIRKSAHPTLKPSDSGFNIKGFQNLRIFCQSTLLKNSENFEKTTFLSL
jgi:hypothetical protein